MPEVQFSLRNTVQCDSTLLANIITCRFVTRRHEYSSQMRVTVSTNDRRARVWIPQGERYADCNIVEVDRYDGGSSWSGPRCPYMAVHTCMCLLDVV